ncbi:LPS assembly lipoprotein LptE [Luteithermobacter gelatinilyticus]|uniref:LPS assembly lipoprotein LptE n=1 Tax=Luteithermobacter gelatinilyticus TaxID=2582913 RepID=UPI0011067279|nr:LPS assembly lipoprotein LptE [Luteithermobacter gelatinilyticus]|tara:strand:+ start:13734 stop:14336 length:603 start_codon:yes stop_codon:yes gene_type:complete
MTHKGSGRMVKTGLVAMVLLALAACGFKPMYGRFSDQGQDMADVMAKIRVVEIRDGEGRNSRIGQVIRNNLAARLSPGREVTSADYVLKVSFQVEEHGYGFTESESVTVQNLKLLALYRLEEADSSKVVVESMARALVTFDLVQSDYSNMIARNTALERLSDEVATRIVARLGAYFSQNGKDGAVAAPDVPAEQNEQDRK